MIDRIPGLVDAIVVFPKNRVIFAVQQRKDVI